MTVVLVLGGARSGKSAVAERLAGRCPPPVSYVATLAVADDEDLAARVAAHRSRRPDEWRTVEAGPDDDLPATVAKVEGTCLVDSLGPWVAGGPRRSADHDALVAALAHRRGDTIVVSEEVGLGVHPATEAGRRFRDELGTLNQALAAVADEVVLVVAGRALALGAGGT